MVTSTPATDPVTMTSEADESLPDDLDQDGKDGFNWLWLVLISVTLLMVAGAVLAFVLIRKKAGRPQGGDES